MADPPNKKKHSYTESVPIPWRLLSCWRRLPEKFKEWRNSNGPTSRDVIIVERVKFTAKIYGQILPANCFKGSTDVVKCNDMMKCKVSKRKWKHRLILQSIPYHFNQKMNIKISKLTISNNIVILLEETHFRQAKIVSTQDSTWCFDLSDLSLFLIILDILNLGLIHCSVTLLLICLDWDWSVLPYIKMVNRSQKTSEARFIDMD